MVVGKDRPSSDVPFLIHTSSSSSHVHTSLQVSKSLQSYESLKSRFYTKFLSLHAHRSRRIQLALDKAAAKSAKGKDIALPLGNVDVVPLGFVRNMAEYMVAADILVTKAGPGTIAEAAAVGLPIMVTSHLPGQEAGNVDIGKCYLMSSIFIYLSCMRC